LATNEKFAEIEILRDDNPAFRPSQRNQFRVARTAMRVRGVRDIIPCNAQRQGNRSGARLIDKKTWSLLCSDDFVGHIIGGEFERSILKSEAWILIRDLRSACTPRAFTEHLFHRHARAANDRLAAHHGGIDLDARVGGHRLSVAHVARRVI
jgi:hypothetical protein